MFVGCDPDGLRDAARAFDTAAESVRRLANTAGTQVVSLDWEGADAVQYLDLIQVGLSTMLENLASQLDEGSWTLSDNADEQAAVSAGLTAFTWEAAKLQMNRLGRAIERKEAQDRRDEADAERWWDRDGSREAARMVNASPEEQRQWWNSLTPAQQALMLGTYGGAYGGWLLGMKGLDPSVHEKARENLKKHYEESVVKSEISTTAEVQVHVPFYKVANIDLGAEASASIQEMADGRYKIKLAMGGNLGASLRAEEGGAGGHVGVGGEAKVEQVYEFANREEADAFLQGLRNELVPTGKEVLSAGVVPAVILADAARDAVVFLKNNGNHLESTTFEAKLTAGGEVKFGDKSGSLSVSESAGVGVRQVTGSDGSTRSLFFERELSVSGSAGEYSGNAHMKAEFELVTKDGQATEIKISGEFSGAGGADIAKIAGVDLAKATGTDSFDLKTVTGAQGTVEVSIPLDNPATADLAKSLIDRAMHGDSEALNDLKSLAQHSEVKLQLNNVTTTTAGFDAKVVEGKITTETTVAAAAYVKPPGAFTLVKVI